MSSPVISVSRLKRSFKSGTGEVTVLKDISLTVPQGEFVAVIEAQADGDAVVVGHAQLGQAAFQVLLGYFLGVLADELVGGTQGFHRGIGRLFAEALGLVLL